MEASQIDTPSPQKKKPHCLILVIKTVMALKNFKINIKKTVVADDLKLLLVF
jgi:hypothetical protein